MPEAIPEEWEQIFYENGMSEDESDTDESDMDMDEDEEGGEDHDMEVDGVEIHVDAECDNDEEHEGAVERAMRNVDMRTKRPKKTKEPLVDYVRNGCVRDIVITGEVRLFGFVGESSIH